MRRRTRFWLKTAIGLVIAVVIVGVAASWYLENADRSKLPETATTGPSPVFLPPNQTLLPTDYALGNHVAALGLAFYTADLLPEPFRGGAFIGEHGSWNRKPPSGYKVVFGPFRDGQPSGQQIDILTGFLSRGGEALGRPLGVAVDRTGALLVADDVGNTVWRVTPSAQQATR
jgi:glucose/arabinose dehydrogenase